MAGITTHVLATAKGRPAAGIRITLHRDARVLFVGETDRDGRARVLDAASVEAGTYRLTFDVGTYNPDGFYPQATIIFYVEYPEAHYHVPLLLSPFGHSTYRGS